MTESFICLNGFEFHKSIAFTRCVSPPQNLMSRWCSSPLWLFGTSLCNESTTEETMLFFAVFRFSWKIEPFDRIRIKVWWENDDVDVFVKWEIIFHFYSCWWKSNWKELFPVKLALRIAMCHVSCVCVVWVWFRAERTMNKRTTTRVANRFRVSLKNKNKIF